MNYKHQEFIIVMLAIIGFIAWVARDLYIEMHKTPSTRIQIAYDCRLAEISVDYPAIVKDKCRKLMQPKIAGVN